eukprot:6501884-Prymnesium_polylepis.1
MNGRTQVPRALPAGLALALAGGSPRAPSAPVLSAPRVLQVPRAKPQAQLQQIDCVDVPQARVDGI